MALKARVWSASKIVVLIMALAATYVLFAFASMRVALRTRNVEIPDLTGYSVAEATNRLTALDLSLRVDAVRRLDPSIPEDHVLDQEPGAGTTMRRERNIRVWLSAGARNTDIPNLIGETERTARLRLETDNLDLQRVAEIRSHDYAEGLIVAQFPPAESTGTEVSLLVNRGEQRTTYVMPDLIGVDGSRVADLLRSREFRVAVVAEQPYPGVPPGIVIRQSPQAGFQVAPGAAVSIEVSR